MKTEKLVIEYEVVKVKSIKPATVEVDGKVYGGVEVSLNGGDSISYVSGVAVSLGLNEDSTHGIVEDGVIVKYIKREK